MIAEQMQVGTVVFDTSAPVPDNRKFFKIVEARDAEIGPWVLEQVVGGARRPVQLTKLTQLRPVDEDDPYEALVGCQVRFALRFGSTASGVFQCVEYSEFALNGADVLVPIAFVLDGEVYPLADIAAVEVL
jgi:hypothetical protein